MKKILLIEDVLEIRENMTEILEHVNYLVLTAENGKAGLELAVKETPDLILCDILMPGLDGFGILSLVRGNPKISSIPFIFLTAKVERTDVKRAMEMGADAFISKPFDVRELLRTIETRLEQSNNAKARTGNLT